jgi:polysaccharide export outer membrane protein
LAFSIRRSLAFTLLGTIYASQVSAGAVVALTREYSGPATVVDPQNAAPQTVGDEGLDLSTDIYIIGPGDQLDLKVFGDEGLSGPLTVLSDGSVSLPYFGSVRLAGLTLQQAMLWIQQLLSQELLRPDLQLTVSQPRPMQISIIGQVQRPGLYTMNASLSGSGGGSGGNQGVGGATGGLPTLVGAIQTAGGITQQASLRDVILQRRLPGLEPRYKLQRLNLFSLLFDGDQLQNPYLFDGDVIKVDLAKETPQQSIELAATNLTPATISINVMGEVKSPGVMQLRANTPLAEAVLMAGGTQEWRANRGDIELVRLNRNGSVTLKRFRLDLAAGASNEKNPPLRNGDIVRVKRSLLAKGSDAITGVTQPFTGLVSVWGLVRLIGGSN